MDTEEGPSGDVVVSCGMLRPGLGRLQEDGFLRPERLIFTAPGLHETPRELEKQLRGQLVNAKRLWERVIVVYGAKCFVDFRDPLRDVEVLIGEEGPGISRVRASNCVDMLADAQERQAIAGGQNLYRLTPGWLRHWRYIFRNWHRGKANETFPQDERTILLAGVGFFEGYTQEHPDEVLALSDWMRISIEPYPVSLGRLWRLLSRDWN